MKLLKLITLSTFVFTSFCFSQTEAVEDLPKVEEQIDFSALKHPIRPMLWKVEKQGAEKASYLFGTIHLSNERLTTLHPLAQAAFDNSNALYTEVRLSIADQLKASKLIMRQDGKTLEESLGAELTAEVNELLKEVNPMLTVELLNTFKTWGVAATLPMLKQRLEKKKPLDVHLWERAVSAEKTVGSLETVEIQIGQFDKLTEDEQILFLRETIKGLKKADKKNKIEEMINTYLKGDEVTFANYLKTEMRKMADDKELSEKITRLLLDERNVIMADSIEKYMSKSPEKVNFFAVGTAHYIGEGSVIEVLTERGFKITRITE